MRLAIVTGASSGIGEATARLLARKGINVALTGRNEDALKRITGEIQSEIGESVKVGYFAADLTTQGHCEKVLQQATDTLGDPKGKLDILVNCAGVLKGGAIGATTLDNFDLNMNLNTRAVFAMMNAAVPYMERPKESNVLTASIVNVSSVNGLQSFAGVAAYCASKAACDMLTDCGAVDLAPKHIRVNSVNPGVVVTELQKRGGMNEQAYSAFLERSRTATHPLGRVANPQEVAEAIYFLADSHKSDFITGTHLKVDGGRSCLGAR